jgi:hypothetical protein
MDAYAAAAKLMMRRECGSCQLCCRLVPVQNDLVDRKPANTRCKYQKFGVGCAVYHTAKMPFECGVWNCRWLVNDDTGNLSRPDRSHYVIDIMPDFVTANGQAIEVIQVWLDPRHPDAHRDPALRAYLERRALENKIGMIRTSASEAFFLIPPIMMPDGKWYEHRNSVSLGHQHSLGEVAAALGGKMGCHHGREINMSLGSGPIDPAYSAKMNQFAQLIDEFVNGKVRGKNRQTGFILMLFPFDDAEAGEPRCNYISNAEREDVVTLLKEQLAYFEGQPEVTGQG